MPILQPLVPTLNATQVCGALQLPEGFVSVAAKVTQICPSLMTIQPHFKLPDPKQENTSEGNWGLTDLYASLAVKSSQLIPKVL